MVPGTYTLRVVDALLPSYTRFEQDSFSFELSPGDEHAVELRVVPEQRQVKILPGETTLVLTGRPESNRDRALVPGRPIRSPIAPAATTAEAATTGTIPGATAATMVAAAVPESVKTPAPEATKVALAALHASGDPTARTRTSRWQFSPCGRGPGSATGLAPSAPPELDEPAPVVEKIVEAWRSLPSCGSDCLPPDFTAPAAVAPTVAAASAIPVTPAVTPAAAVPGRPPCRPRCQRLLPPTVRPPLLCPDDLCPAETAPGHNDQTASHRSGRTGSFAHASADNDPHPAAHADSPAPGDRPRADTHAARRSRRRHAVDLAATGLPLVPFLPRIDEALERRRLCVLTAEPGAGKSTLVPAYLLDRPWLAGRKIRMLEPRRLAAAAVAARISELLGEPLGRRAGYRVRSAVTGRTRDPARGDHRGASRAGARSRSPARRHGPGDPRRVPRALDPRRPRAWRCCSRRAGPGPTSPCS